MISKTKSKFDFFKKPDNHFNFNDLFKPANRLPFGTSNENESVKVYSMHQSDRARDRSFAEQPIDNVKQILQTKIVKNYLFALFLVYKQFFFISKKKLINEDVILVMNRLSLVGLLFSLMFLGIIFFLAGFLVSANINYSHVSNEERATNAHEPSQEALVRGKSAHASKIPNGEKLIPNGYKNANDPIIYGARRKPTNMKNNRQPPTHHPNNYAPQQNMQQYPSQNWQTLPPNYPPQNYNTQNYNPQNYPPQNNY